MSQSKTSVRAAARDFTQAASDVGEGVGDAIHAVGDTARAAVHQARKSAGHIVGAVEEKYEEAGQLARDTYRHGRERAERWENNFEGIVCSRPLVSLLIAAGVGAVVGAILFHGRRH
jgi:ElaB/YqjD/DUF883 family membrane-anchored ribosome-binding protein